MKCFPPKSLSAKGKPCPGIASYMINATPAPGKNHDNVQKYNFAESEI